MTTSTSWLRRQLQRKEGFVIFGGVQVMWHGGLSLEREAYIANTSTADSGEVSLIVRKPTWRRDTVIVCGVETPHTRLLPCTGPNSLSGNKQWTIEHPLINTRIYLVTLASDISVTSSLEEPVKDFKRDLTNIQLIQSPFSVLQACGCESELSVTPLERWYATRGESEGSFLCSYFWGEATVGDDKIDMFGTGQKERWAEEASKWKWSRKRFQNLALLGKHLCHGEISIPESGYYHKSNSSFYRKVI